MQAGGEPAVGFEPTTYRYEIQSECSPPSAPACPSCFWLRAHPLSSRGYAAVRQLGSTVGSTDASHLPRERAADRLVAYMLGKPGFVLVRQL